MSKAYYVLVSSSYDELEVYLKGMTGRVGSAQSIEKRLQQYGFTERDYCLVNQPVSFLGTYMKMKRSQFNISDKSTQNKLERMSAVPSRSLPSARINSTVSVALLSAIRKA